MADENEWADGNWKGTCIVIAILSLVALLDMPYGYYTFLRWAVTLMAGAAAWRLLQKQIPLGWLFAAIAVIFNPIMIIGLSKSAWAPINVITAIVFLLAMPALMKDSKH
jgi:hypothetical protein